jgi:2'-5' RNA ligase
MTTYFLTVYVPQEFREPVRAAQKLVPGEIAVPFREYPHVTLRYVGEAEDDVIEKLHRRLCEISADTKPFEIKVPGKTELFGKEKDYLVAKIESPELHDLHKEVDDACLDCGVEQEKWPKYQPHLSLAQNDQMPGFDATEVEKALPGSFTANQFVLASSDPHSGDYKPEKVYLLGRNKVAAEIKKAIDLPHVQAYWDFVEEEVIPFYRKAQKYAQKGLKKVAKRHKVNPGEMPAWLSFEPLDLPINQDAMDWIEMDFLPWVQKQMKRSFFGFAKKHGIKPGLLAKNLAEPRRTTTHRDLQPFVAYALVVRPAPKHLVRTLGSLIS